MNDCEKIRFRKIAGGRQPMVEDAFELRRMISVDPALWAVTSFPIDGVVFDKDFLTLMDTDKNGRIRPGEFIDALKWIFSVLKGFSGIDDASDAVELAEINENSEDGKTILCLAKRILSNIGAPDAKRITFAQTADQKNVISDPLRNGDGVIPPEAVGDPVLEKYIRDAMKCVANVLDASGAMGIDGAGLAAFDSGIKVFHDWFMKESSGSELVPFGKETSAMHALYAPVKAKLDEFFRLCESMKGSAAARFDTILKNDPFDVDATEAFLKKAPVATPNPECTLDMSDWVNPDFRSALSAFMEKAKSLGAAGSAETLSIGEWRRIDAALTPRSAWLAQMPGGAFDKLDHDAICEYLEKDCFIRLSKIMEEDKSVKKAIDSYSALRKLMIFQKNILEFANNFVTLSRLFDPNAYSMIQPGTLIIDGRRFTLCAKVTDLAEHKKIIERSNICVMYVEVTESVTPAPKKMNLAVAVTSGTMRNLFVGKRGFFTGGDSVEWDAKIIDFIQQPVSLREAFQTPFYKIGEFAGKQADKFFSARSQAVESNIAKDVDTHAKAAPGAPQQTPAVSGSMVLMGGGIGLAALGSSVAFIANTLKNVSPLSVISVLAGIVLIISAPIIFVSIVKLWNRSAADFLAASGWAVNPKMRLSRRMGLIFTHGPEIDFEVENVRGNMINSYSKRFEDPSRFSRIFWTCFVIGALATALVVFVIFNNMETDSTAKLEHIEKSALVHKQQKAKAQPDVKNEKDSVSPVQTPTAPTAAAPAAAK